MKKSQKLDEKRLEILIRAAQMTGNYHIEEIGNNISTIADVALSQPCFRNYFDEWRGELRSVAYEYMMSALKTFDDTKGSAFTYLYGIAMKACGRYIKKLKRSIFVRLPDSPSASDAPKKNEVSAQESLYSLGGAMPVRKYRKENPCNWVKKVVRLRNVINRATELAIETMNIEQIDDLLERAVRNRRLHA